MSAYPQSEGLLQRVRRRLFVRRLAGMVYWTTLGLSCAYLGLLLIGRLTGSFPGWFPLWSAPAVPALGCALALLLARRPLLVEAARAVDRQAQTQDLFLTLITLQGAGSDYQPLVGRDAERAAPPIQPQRVVPYPWERRALAAAAVLGLLLAASWLVPTLDPFGKMAAAQQADEALKLLEASKEATAARQAQLAQKDLADEHSEAVEKALESLQSSFQQFKPGQAKQNLERLSAHQKEIGEIFRKLNSGELRKLFDGLQGDQQLGQMHDQELFRQMQRELQAGSSEKLQGELAKVAENIKKLGQSTDPVERSELQRQVQKQLKELSDFAATKTGSQALNAALQRAAQQLEAAKQQGLSKEALDALQESLEVAEKEAQQLAQSARDLKSLEDALKLISMAKQAKGEPAQGEEGAEGELSLSDYAELYAELMRQYQQMEGTGGEGQGNSESVPEDESAVTGFVDEKSKSAIQKGKILLSMKSKGLSDAGDVKDENYKRIVGEIRQSLDDVINQEEIPPGYVEGIKKYFDSIEKK